MTWRVNRFVVIAIITLALGLLAINKFWFPFDDGTTLVSSELILKGDVPYKDFLIQYPPLHYYIIAFLFKIFGINHLVARSYTIFTYVFISVFAFYAASLFARASRKIAYLIWATCAISLVPRLGSNVSINWSALFFAYLGLLFFYMFVTRRKTYLIFLSGLSAGFALMAKQDMGVYVAAAQAIALFSIPLINREGWKGGFIFILKRGFVYLAGVAMVPAAYLSYLIKIGAFHDFVNAILLPATVMHRYARIDLTSPCFDLRQIFYGECRFISINQFYIPILVYALAAFLLLRSVICAGDREKRNEDTLALALLVFGAMSYFYVLYRADDMHLLFVLTPALILSGYVYSRARAIANMPARILTKIVVYIICGLMVLLIIKNSDKCLKNTIVKAWDKRIIKFENDRGDIYIPKKEYGPMTSLIKFIKANSAEGERILMWNKGSAANAMGIGSIVYFFSGRLPVTKYFIVQIGYTNSPTIQEDIVKSLEKYHTKLVVLVDCQESAQDPAASRGFIDKYVESHYYPAERIDTYQVYLRKG